MNEKLKILFLCVGNSCRSQMAEGFARVLKSDVIEPFSAGTRPGVLNPSAVNVMAEAGVDISNHRSKYVEELFEIPFDYVITLCEEGAAECPVFIGASRVMHQPFDDPPKLAATAASDEEALAHYRRVRDEIKDFVESLPASLDEYFRKLSEAFSPLY